MENDNKTCLNCAAPFPEGAIYCPVCGQKKGTGKVTLGTLVGEFFSNFFNLDSKTIRTALALFIPGKLTKEYFEGKHLTYSHPMRLFFVAAIFFFALVSWNVNTSSLQTGVVGNIRQKIERSKDLVLIDSIKEVVALDFPQVEARAALDSLYQKLLPQNAIDSIKIDSGFFNLNIDVVKINRDSIFIGKWMVDQQDFVNLSATDLVDKYGEDLSFFEKIFARQTLKMVKEGNSMVEYLLGKSPLIVLLMMPFLALFLKLLYFRRKRYYVEHLFFSFHFHAFVFIWGALLIALRNVLPSGLLAILGLCIFVYLLLALKKVYGQGWGKTILKLFLLTFGYCLLLILFLILSLTVSFILF